MAPGGGSPSSAKRGRGAAQGGGAQQPPRCQVEGCGEDLTGAKSYYCRHKVCGTHSKSPKVIVAGIEQRFCQQCSRFHLLAEFDKGKRSCRRRLAGHNERRRKPPPGSFSSRYGQLSSSFHDDGKLRSFVMDFSCPKIPDHESELFASTGASVRATLSNQWPSGQLDVLPSGRIVEQVITPYSQGSNGRTLFSAQEVPPDECLVVSNSSCALSLLSSQQWGTTSASDQAVSISTSNYIGASMTQPSYTTSFMGNPFTSNRHEINTISAHKMSPGVSFGQEMELGLGHLSCEPELCSPSNQQCMEHGPGRAYCPTSNQIHWPH